MFNYTIFVSFFIGLILLSINYLFVLNSLYDLFDRYVSCDYHNKNNISCDYHNTVNISCDYHNTNNISCDYHNTNNKRFQDYLMIKLVKLRTDACCLTALGCTTLNWKICSDLSHRKNLYVNIFTDI